MLEYALKLRTSAGGKLAKKARALAGRLDLDLSKKIAALSLGNKRKVGIILSIFFDPKLIIMDEPTTGLDPLIQREVLEILREMSREGTGVLLSCHNLTEVEQICDRVIIIKQAKTIFSDKISNIKKLAQNECALSLLALVSLLKAAVSSKKIKKLTAGEITEFGGHVELLSNKASRVVSILLAEGITEFTLENPSLEEMFINYYKK